MTTTITSPLVLLFLLVACWLVHRLVRARARVKSTSGLPGPNAAHWLWGHELIAHEIPYEEAYTRWMDSYGPTYKIKGALSHPDIIVTVDQTAINHICGKRVYSYVKSSLIRALVERLVGRGLIWAEGTVHKRQRQQLAPFFTTQAIRGMFNSFNSCAQAGTEDLELYINTNAKNSKEGLNLDISEWTASITLDIIGRFAFNYDFESGRSHAAQVIQKSWREQVGAGLFRTAVIGQIIARAFPIVTQLPIPVLEAQLVAKRTLRETAQSIVDQDVGQGKEKDMLTTMARLSRRGEVSSTPEELLDHVCTMVVGGQETTSSSLGFALHQLALNPGYQIRLREEIVQLGREPTYDDLMSGMPWLDAVTKEIFRRRPVVPHMERVVTEDCILPLGTPVKTSDGTRITEIPIKAGQMILIPITSMNHMKSMWGEDADEFRPERWLDPTRLEHVNSNFGWNGMLVFSEGPRQCIGYRMAVLSFKTILSAYIRKFEFHDTGAIIHGRYVGTMQPYVAGQEDKGTQMPLHVTLVDEPGNN